MEDTSKWYADMGNGMYQNPILYTDYSDPDVIRVGADYFMTASTFCNTPGLPILHSKDLVNWKVINYALENIPFERYETPQHGCGVWAPSIRYHEGMFYIFFPMPDEGIFVTKTENPYGEWSVPHAIYKGKGWIDPCPLWDEDGKAYMVSAYAKSRIGFKSILHINEITPDCMSLIGEGKDIFDGNVEDEETIEGPKLYKRNGYYYIFAPAGGVKVGWQTVLRSKNIFGAYEKRRVMVQGNTIINGPHQGGYVDTQTGEAFFLHFQDVYAAGRIVHMQPMVWENGWPIIGERISEEAGQPVAIHKKPNIGNESALTNDIFAPDASDDFTGEKMGLQWQWNANHCNSWYELKHQKLRLYAVEKKAEDSIANTANLLLQKWNLPEFIADTVVDLSGMEIGDVAGIVSMGVTYGAINIRCVDIQFRKAYDIESILGRQTFDGIKFWSSDIIDEIERTNVTRIYLRNRVERVPSKQKGIPREKISLEYSLDGESFVRAISFTAEAGRWVGVKNGMYCCHEGDGIKGFTEFDYYRIHN